MLDVAERAIGDGQPQNVPEQTDLDGRDMCRRLGHGGLKPRAGAGAPRPAAADPGDGRSPLGTLDTTAGGGFAPGLPGRLRGGPGGDPREPRPLYATDAVHGRIEAHQDPAAPLGPPVLAVQQNGHIQPVVLFGEVTRPPLPERNGQDTDVPAKPLSLTKGSSLPADVSTATAMPLARQVTGSPAGSLTEVEPSNGWLLNPRSRPSKREATLVAASMSSTGNSTLHALPSRAAGAKCSYQV